MRDELLGPLRRFQEPEPMGDSDRRGLPRYPTVENRVRLTWHGPEGEAHESPGRIVNISRGGVALVADAVPEGAPSAWLRLEQPVTTAWVKADVVWTRQPRLAGLEFTGECPRDLYKTATCGRSPDDSVVMRRRPDIDPLDRR